jgi:hypothetical protein
MASRSKRSGSVSENKGEDDFKAKNIQQVALVALVS